MLSDQSTAHFFGVVVLGGNEVDLNNTDQGNVVTGSIKKIIRARIPTAIESNLRQESRGSRVALVWVINRTSAAATSRLVCAKAGSNRPVPVRAGRSGSGRNPIAAR